MELEERLRNCTGFQWDEGNQDKNWVLHGVHRGEAEQAFFNDPFIVSDDLDHTEGEERFFLLGQTNSKRLLFIVFTIREDQIRVISARDMTKSEREVYRTL